MIHDALREYHGKAHAASRIEHLHHRRVSENDPMIIRDVRHRWRWKMLERIVSWSLLQMAKLADRDNDLHEINHIEAQLKAGDTSNCGPECELRKVQSG